RSRAETEIAAMSAAVESYKADNGIYPRTLATDSLNAKISTDPSNYQSASLYLYTQLSGLDTNQQAVANMKTYFAFKSQMQGQPAAGNFQQAGGLNLARNPRLHFSRSCAPQSLLAG